PVLLVYPLPTALHLAAAEPALVGELQVAAPNRLAQLRVHQFVDVELHLVARVRRHVEDSGVHADGVFGAYLHTVSAVDADPEVNVNADGILRDFGAGVLSRHDGDALRGTHGLAEHAPYAAGRTLLANREPVAASEPPSERPRLFRILESDGSREALEQAQAVRRVKKKVPEKVCGGDLEPAQNLRNIELLPESQLAPMEYLYRHQDAPLKKNNTEAVTTTLATAIGKSPLQPN